MDFGALPPEINSARMYAGPGSGPMLAAAGAWSGLAAELQSTASSYGSVVTQLTDESWLGPSAAAMAAAAAPYVAWMDLAAGQAEQAASQARTAAGAYQMAFAMTVPPPVIAANRGQLAALTAANIFGQNTPAIAATEAHYAQMWAQDAAAMYGYAGNSAAASVLTPFRSPPSTTNPAGAAIQAATTTAGSSQASLSQLISALLQGLASPASASASTTAPDAGLSGLLSALLGTVTGTTSPFGGMSESLLVNYLTVPAYFAYFMAVNSISPHLSHAAEAMYAQPVDDVPDTEDMTLNEGTWDDAGGEWDGGEGAWEPDGGATAALGEAPALGGLSVPPAWGWAAAGPAPMPMLAPDIPSPAGGFGSGWGLPPILAGLPRAAAAGAIAGVGGVAALKYGHHLKVVLRPAAAGYPPESEAPPPPAHPAPGPIKAPPGYRPAIVYLPTNGHSPAIT